MTSKSTRGLMLVMTAAILWGTGGIAKQAVSTLAATNALSIAFFRMAFSAPVLIVLSAIILGRRFFSFDRRDLPAMLAIGGLTALYQALYFGAIGQIGVAAATLVTLCSAPVIVALLSALHARARPSLSTLIALSFALCGTALLTNVDNLAQGGSIYWGVGLSLGSATMYAVVTLLGRRIGERVHPLQTATLGFSFGALILLLLASANGLVTQYPTPAWGLLIYLGVLPTAVAYALFLAGMRTTPATSASIATLLEPLTAAALAWMIFGEKLSPLGLVGGGLLCAAMVVLLTTKPAVKALEPEIPLA